ncbi:hypothetical protein IH970_06135 [candidate division KSB1 bacterium]|nr:hypothetical protein [candidate division KSB1 bacterium]
MSRETPASALQPAGIDAYAPVVIAQRAITSGETKAGATWLQLASLGVLAGGFIGFGAIFANVATRDR